MTLRAEPLGFEVGGVRTFSGYGASPILRTRFFLRLIRTLLRSGGRSDVFLSAAWPCLVACFLDFSPLRVNSPSEDARLVFFFFGLEACISISIGDPSAVARFSDLFFSLAASTFSGDAVCFFFDFSLSTFAFSSFDLPAFGFPGFAFRDDCLSPESSPCLSCFAASSSLDEASYMYFLFGALVSRSDPLANKSSASPTTSTESNGFARSAAFLATSANTPVYNLVSKILFFVATMPSINGCSSATTVLPFNCLFPAPEASPALTISSTAISQTKYANPAPKSFAVGIARTSSSKTTQYRSTTSGSHLDLSSRISAAAYTFRTSTRYLFIRC
mmetsp:Transcript_12902/g.37041  ORF Transcript_12902/g.37041 Transcript_12902/m.37041 type:complete len:332 (-) Transcript_12902:3444-4439(-)